MWRCSSLYFVFFIKWFRVILMLHFAYEYPYCTLATNQTTHTKQYRTHLSKNIDCFCEPYLPCFDMFVDSRSTAGLIICTPFLCREIRIMLYSVWWLIDINEIMSFQKSTFSSVLNYFMTFQYIFLVYGEKFGKAAF